MDERLSFADARRVLGVEPDADARTLRRGLAAAAAAGLGDEKALRRAIAAWRLLSAPRPATFFAPAPAPRDFHSEIRVGLPEAVAGETRLLSLPGGETFRVRIPAGARDGLTLRLRGAAPGGGDVLLRLRVTAAQPARRSAGDLIRRFSRAWAA